MRKLASVQTIDSLYEIPGADRIEMAQVLGWQCVVKKGEFQVGDKCIYFEIDSILPDLPCFEFMRERKFRVKTAKFKGQISQGLAMPFEGPGITLNYDIGDDLTEILGVKKHDPEGDREARIMATQSPKKYPWWTRLPFGMKLYRHLNPRRGGWPDFLPKTDETRVQNIRNISKHIGDRELYSTEKIDGQSMTVYCNLNERTGILSKGSTGVCSRNIHYPTFVSNNWWNFAKEWEMVETLERFCKAEGRSLAIQGELAGPGIQDNKYKVNNRFFYAFNVFDIDKQRYLSLFEKLEVLDVLGWVHVPFISIDYSHVGILDTDWFVGVADGMSIVTESECLREGLVFRDKADDGFSFKAISNKWLLKHKE